MRKLFLSLVFLLTLFISPTHAYSFDESIKKNLVLAALLICGNTVHEMGHAVAQKCLTDKWPDTAHVGFGFGFVNNTNSDDPYTYACPKPELRDDKGFQPGCWGDYDTMLLMGPLSGMMFHFLMYNSWGFFFTGETLNTLEQISKALMILDGGNLFPLPHFTDGAQILQNIYPDANLFIKGAIIAVPVFLLPHSSSLDRWVMNRSIMLASATLISKMTFKLW